LRTAAIGGMALNNIEIYCGLSGHRGTPDSMAQASGHLAKVRVGRSIRLARSKFYKQNNMLPAASCAIKWRDPVWVMDG
jgi:hypothetical protein